MLSAANSANDSAQSPACSRNARPWATWAKAAVSCRASPATTNGGSAASRVSTRLRASSSGHTGCWAAGRFRHDAAFHPAAGRPASPGVSWASAPGVSWESVGRAVDIGFQRTASATTPTTPNVSWMPEGTTDPIRAERIGLLGGTFDPPHAGHLAAALACRDALALDRLLLVVANHPWQKAPQRRISPAEDRLAMVQAAVDGVPGLEVSRMEIDRGGPSYTIETVDALRQDAADA